MNSQPVPAGQGGPPSCLESLASSGLQLGKLAREAHHYYINSVLALAATNNSNHCQPSRPKPNRWLQLMLGQGQPEVGCQLETDTAQSVADFERTLRLLPFLDELANFIDGCVATIETAFKRIAYHLERAHSKPKEGPQLEQQLYLTGQTKPYVVFVALLDLLYALISLDKTLELDTGLRDSLAAAIDTCRLVLELNQTATPSGGAPLASLPRDKLGALLQHLIAIQISLGGGGTGNSIFRHCISQLQHLSHRLEPPAPAPKAGPGKTTLADYLEDFIELYCSAHCLGAPVNCTTHSSLHRQLIAIAPTGGPYLGGSAQRLFGACTLYLLLSWLFRPASKRLAKTLSQCLMQSRPPADTVHLLGSSAHLYLHQFLAEHLPPSWAGLDQRALRHLKELSGCGPPAMGDGPSLAQPHFESLTLRGHRWLAHFGKLIGRARQQPPLALDQLKGLVQLQWQASSLAREMNRTVRGALIGTSGHSAGPHLQPMRLVALIKAIEEAALGAASQLSALNRQAKRSFQLHLAELLHLVRRRLIGQRVSERRLSLTSALQILSLCSPADLASLADEQVPLSVFHLSLTMALPLLERAELAKLADLLQLWPPPAASLPISASCAYLFWYMPLFGPYYASCLQLNPSNVRELQYFHLALDNIAAIFEGPQSKGSSGEPHERGQLFLKQLTDELVHQFKAELLDRLCQELEIELRLQTHLHLKLDSHNPFRRQLYNFKQILSGAATNNQRRRELVFKLLGVTIPVHQYLEQYLSRNCYVLTAVAPQNWFTYDRMLHLAERKYSLRSARLQLPAAHLSHSGLDLIDIGRHLSQFMAHFSYDMAHQLLIEKCTSLRWPQIITSGLAGCPSPAGSVSSLAGPAPMASVANQPPLSVVQAAHFAQSIQTHGFGLLNSTVNRTYQLIKRLINVFAKQLADEQLRAALVKEQQYKQSMEQGGSPVGPAKGPLPAGPTDESEPLSERNFGFERANRLARRFRFRRAKQSAATPPVHFDSIRQTVTRLGNLLAFIRLLKSGALQCASLSAEYLPDSEPAPSEGSAESDTFEGLLSSELPHRLHNEPLKEAAKNLDQCLAELGENFSPNTNYFGLLIDLFGGLLSGSGREAVVSSTLPETTGASTESAWSAADGADNLRLFYLLLPPLSINFIEYISNCQERAAARSSAAAARFGALISDDGFPLGAAFLLTVLKQTDQFASFEWFDEVDGRLAEDCSEIRARLADTSFEESLKQTSSMTLRRLDWLRREYRSLDHTLNSSLLLLRLDDLRRPAACGCRPNSNS